MPRLLYNILIDNRTSQSTNVGKLKMDSELNITEFTVKQLCIKFRNNFIFNTNTKMYLKLPIFSGCIISNTTGGFPLTYHGFTNSVTPNDGNLISVTYPDVTIETSTKVPMNMDYVICDQLNEPIDMTLINSIELMMTFKTKD